MTVRNRTVLLAIVVGLVGAALLGYWSRRQGQIEHLIDERQTLIRAIETAAASGGDTSRGVLRAEELRDDGRLRERRYYRDDQLVGLDIVDERGKTVRRDLYADGTVRVQLFYDAGGGLVVQKVLGERGDVVTSTPFIPLGPTRSGY